MAVVENPATLAACGVLEIDQRSSRIEVETKSSRHQKQDAERDLLLVALRAGSLRARLAAAEIDQIGIALKFNIIDPDTAVRWIEHEFGVGVWLLPDWRAAQ